METLVSRAVAHVLTTVANFCLRTSRFQLSAQAEDVLARTWDAETPAIFVYWHDEFVLNVLLPLHWRAARVRPEMPACGANDAFGGKVIWSCLSRLGVPLALLPRRSDRATKLEALTQALLRHKHLLLAADYGHPWFEARPTAWQIARTTRARVVAMHIHSSRPWIIARGTWKLRLPRPFGTYELRLVELGEDDGQDDETLARRLTAALDSLRGPASFQTTPVKRAA